MFLERMVAINSRAGTNKISGDIMTAMDKLAAENRERVMKLVDYKTEAVASRDKLDLQNPAERVTAYTRACNEDQELYKLYRRVISVPVGRVSLTE
jgi:hypothetical protein